MTIGIIAAMFMSLGMGLTISLAGLLVSSVQKTRPIITQPRWFWTIRLIGVLLVIALGLWFLLNPISTRAF
jgi:cytochrome c biogenesis protein CcdA